MYYFYHKLYTGIYSSRLIFAHFARIVSGRIFLFFMLEHNAISRRTCCMCKRTKITRAKIAIYTRLHFNADQNFVSVVFVCFFFFCFCFCFFVFFFGGGGCLLGFFHVRGAESNSKSCTYNRLTFASKPQLLYSKCSKIGFLSNKNVN